MSLFDNARDANYNSLVSLVDHVLGSLGHQPQSCRVEAGHARMAWQLQHGSATVRVELLDRDDFLHIRTVAPVMTLTPDVDANALYRRALELNGGALVGAAFAMDADTLQLVSERSTLDLDRSELVELLDRIRSYADRYDDELVAEFGGQRGGG